VTAGLEPLRASAPGTDSAAEALRTAGVSPSAWSNGPGDTYAAHEHPYTKLLICAEGSITFLIGPDEEPAELAAGEGFVLPAGTRHAARVGPRGCTCLAGHRPPTEG
jgi:mannose-6-phosphate isomerase-like protein (cupin superfamily)